MRSSENANDIFMIKKSINEDKCDQHMSVSSSNKLKNAIVRKSQSQIFHFENDDKRDIKRYEWNWRRTRSSLNFNRRKQCIEGGRDLIMIDVDHLSICLFYFHLSIVILWNEHYFALKKSFSQYNWKISACWVLSRWLEKQFSNLLPIEN